MATTDTAALAPLSRLDLAGLSAVWPKPSPALALTVIDAMRVLSLRHLAGGGTAALAAVLTAQGLQPIPDPGRSSGIEPKLIWRSPSETLLLTHDAACSTSLLAALRPTPGVLAFALDLSAGTLVVELNGSALDALLPRLVDADALPRDTGLAARTRLADIAATVWRSAPDRVGLLVDRANDHYLARCLSYAIEVM